MTIYERKCLLMISIIVLFRTMRIKQHQQQIVKVVSSPAQSTNIIGSVQHVPIGQAQQIPQSPHHIQHQVRLLPLGSEVILTEEQFRNYILNSATNQIDLQQQQQQQQAHITSQAPQVAAQQPTQQIQTSQPQLAIIQQGTDIFSIETRKNLIL